jgi:hypothetical protein
MQIALQALQIAWPIIEALIKAIQAGKVDDFILTIPSPLRSRVALNARKVLGY